MSKTQTAIISILLVLSFFNFYTSALWNERIQELDEWKLENSIEKREGIFDNFGRSDEVVIEQKSYKRYQGTAQSVISYKHLTTINVKLNDVGYMLITIPEGFAVGYVGKTYEVLIRTI